MTVAKSLAGGFPLSGLIGRSAVMDSVEPGGLGGTYGGNPIAIAAALAVLDVIEEENLVARANEIGGLVNARISAWSERKDLIPIKGPRGLGAMIAFDVLTDDGAFDGVRAKAICARALEAGLVVLTCGQFGQAIRILVPLTASISVINEGLDILERALVKS
jgi:4-aminobutyrate aminotransferase/(S)-3-amino-2-methylpropionate transaminase